MRALMKWGGWRSKQPVVLAEIRQVLGGKHSLTRWVGSIGIRLQLGAAAGWYTNLRHQGPKSGARIRPAAWACSA